MSAKDSTVWRAIYCPRLRQRSLRLGCTAMMKSERSTPPSILQPTSR